MKVRTIWTKLLVHFLDWVDNNYKFHFCKVEKITWDGLGNLNEIEKPPKVLFGFFCDKQEALSQILIRVVNCLYIS